MMLAPVMHHPVIHSAARYVRGAVGLTRALYADTARSAAYDKALRSVQKMPEAERQRGAAAFEARPPSPGHKSIAHRAHPLAAPLRASWCQHWQRSLDA